MGLFCTINYRSTKFESKMCHLVLGFCHGYVIYVTWFNRDTDAKDLFFQMRVLEGCLIKNPRFSNEKCIASSC